MTDVETINFVDLDSGEEAVVVVRVVDGATGPALSIQSNGDVEAFLGARELDELIDALRRSRGLLAADQ
jgi:hypothetical protein